MALNICHQQQKCVAPCAAFRVLGFFETAEEVREQFEDFPLDVFTIPVFSWMPVTREPVQDAEARAAQVVERVQSYVSKTKEEIDTIMEQTAEDQLDARLDSVHQYTERCGAVQAVLESLRDGGETKSIDPMKLGRKQKLPDQKWCCVSIITEAAVDDEPLLLFTRAFSNREDADDYLRNTLLEEDPQTDFYIVKMYEFVVPLDTVLPGFTSKVKTSYMHEEIEKVLSNDKAHQNNIRRIISACTGDEDRITDEAKVLLAGSA